MNNVKIWNKTKQVLKCYHHNNYLYIIPLRSSVNGSSRHSWPCPVARHHQKPWQHL